MSGESDEQPEVWEPPASDAFDALQADYRTTLRKLSNLPELPMRAARLGEALRERPADEAVWWIDQLMRGALWGQSPEMDAMMACSLWLIRSRLDDDYALLQSLFQAAYDAERAGVISLLRDPPPHRALPKGKRLPEPDLQVSGNVTVGGKRSLARGNNRLLIEKLLLDPNPVVIEQLLDNPNLRERDVLLVSSRRPNTPEILQTVALHKRWIKRLEVRFSVVMNPYAATGISLKMLPTLGIQKLRQVRNSTHLHPAVLDTAQMLVELREEKTAPWRV